MTLRHLNIFVSVYEYNSITKAADALHIAQPSVSLVIKELEEYYGIQLFDRIGRGITPTEAGKELYSYAIHIVSLFNEMAQRIKNWDNVGTLRIGASITIGTHILPGLIKEYQKDFPYLRIKVTVNKSATIEQHILDNKIDIGLIENQPDHPEILSQPFMKDNLCAIVPNEDPLSSKAYITLEELASRPFLMREKGSAGREILDACFSLKNIHVNPLWESSSTQAIVKGVSMNLGVAVLPYLLIKRDIEEHNVNYLPFKTPLTRNLNIIYHKSKYLTRNMLSFIGLCKKNGQESFGVHPVK